MPLIRSLRPALGLTILGLTINVLVACARSAATAAGAPWVVMLKVSKTSNLIWLLTGQLIYAPTGKVVLDDSTELKNRPRGPAVYTVY